MTPVRDRSILGIFSIVLFLCLSYILFVITPRLDINISAFHSFTSLLVLSFNIAIIFSWLNFGIMGGLLFTALSFVVGLSGAIRSGCYSSSALAWSYIITMVIGYSHWKAANKLKQTFALKSEKRDEDINILSDNIHRKKDDIKHLDEKLLRYLILKDVAESLTTTLSLDDIAALIIERASNTIKKEGRVLLYLVDMEKQELMLSASQGALSVKAKKGDVFDRWVLKHGIPLIIEDVAKDFRFSSKDSEAAKESFRSLIVSPLLSGNKIIGVLRMDSLNEGVYTQDDLRLFDIIGNLGAVAIQNAFLYSWVQELAIRDSLTGLFVRRYFMKRFQEEIKRTARKNGTLSLLILDIDHFKSYNDKFGHATGDIVLKYLARAMTSSVREGDMVARYGGEEIAILLINTDFERAGKIAESIRKRVEDEPFVLRREKQNLTVSIGLSNYPKDSMSEEELIKIADNRLYKAKSLGRNRVCEN